MHIVKVFLSHPLSLLFLLIIMVPRRDQDILIKNQKTCVLDERYLCCVNVCLRMCVYVCVCGVGCGKDCAGWNY
ncbi:hypothetical protein F5X96DRAFT_614288 [Biscogniauxia mediterranea]|nr:hypothetical protein F5X96DRAFT_614288 [Biscogniauxia mediterranea]